MIGVSTHQRVFGKQLGSSLYPAKRGKVNQDSDGQNSVVLSTLNCFGDQSMYF